MNAKALAVAVNIVFFLATFNAITYAQNSTTVRNSIPEKKLKLPEYFGFYAVKQTGETFILDHPIERLDDIPTLSLPQDIEFLIYGKDIDPSEIHLIIIPVAQLQKTSQQGEKPFSWDDWMRNATDMSAMTGIPSESREGKLLVKPISNQPQMLRLIPSGELPEGVYQIGSSDKVWYRFVVGQFNFTPAGGDTKAVLWKVVNERWVQNTYANGDVTMSDKTTGKMWLYSANPCERKYLDDAVSYCNNMTYAGYFDWSIPQKEELLAQFSQKGYFADVQAGGYWSGTSGANTSGYAWLVHMPSGSVDYYNGKVYNGYVWPVRDGQ